MGRVELIGSVVDGADTGLFAYVADWRILEERGRGWVCQPTGTVRIIMLDEIKGSVIWSEDAAAGREKIERERGRRREEKGGKRD